MSLRFYQVDAFADRPFAGNPAAVFVLDAPRDADWMQKIATEMNLSETAFVVRQPEGLGLRWFTPGGEVDLCGHATLASAHVLYETGALAAGAEVRFSTRSGVLVARQDGTAIVLDFPATPAAPCVTSDALAKALGAKVVASAKSKFDYLAEVESEAVLRALVPDQGLLATLEARGIIVTARASTASYDFVSRFFAPRVGIAEDPVTGSAHCCLAPFWAPRLGKNVFKAYQASPRGGTLDVALAGDRVELGGRAITIFEGALRPAAS